MVGKRPAEFVPCCLGVTSLWKILHSWCEGGKCPDCHGVSCSPSIPPFLHPSLLLWKMEKAGWWGKNKAAHPHPLMQGLFFMLGYSNGCFVHFRSGLRSQGLADPPQLVAEDQAVVSVLCELQRYKVLWEKTGNRTGSCGEVRDWGEHRHCDRSYSVQWFV